MHWIPPYRRALRVFVLLTVCNLLWIPLASAQGTNAYERDFSEVQAEFATASPPRQAVLLRRATDLREFVNNAADVERWLGAIQADPRVNRLVRDEAVHDLAAIDLHNARLEAAEAKWTELGFIREWSVIGPFAAEDGLATPLGPDHGYSSADTFAGDSGRLSWRNIRKPAPQMWIDLAHFMSRPSETVAYAATSVVATTETTVALRLGCDSAVAVLVNGEQVFRHDSTSNAAFDQYAVAVRLHPGPNSIFLKFYHHSRSTWRFAVRLTALAGGGIRMVVQEPQDDAFLHHGGREALPAPQDLVELAKQELRSEPNSANKLEALGLIERLHGRGAELDHLTAAARLKPTAAYFLTIAESCSEQRCRFAALQSALRLEPSNHNALRALADYYHSRSQLERSRELLEQAISVAPTDYVAKENLAEVLLSAGLKESALVTLHSLQRQFPSPLWLRRKLAERYAYFGFFDESLKLLVSVLPEDFDNSSTRRLFIELLEKRHDTQALFAAYRDARSLSPHDPALLAKVAELQAGAGDFASAEQTMREAEEVNPCDDQIRQQLSTLLARAGKMVAAEQALASTSNLNPQLEFASRRFDLGRGEASADPDAQYLESASKLAAQVHGNLASNSGANAVALANVRVERMYENGLASIRVQQIFYIASRQGAREYATRTVQYAPESQSLRVIRARTIKPDGRVLEATQGSESLLADRNVSMYYDVRSREIHYSRLEKGDVIELDYRLTPTTDVNPYGSYFASLVVFRSSTPESLRRYVLVAPSDRTLNIVESRLPTARPVMDSYGHRVYKWELRDVSALRNEPRGPAVTEISPYVHVSTFSSWEELGKWYAQLIRPQFKIDDAIREATANAVAGKSTDLDKVHAIYRFVLDNTHYVALEFGVYSYKPYAVSDTLARRFGDCKDKASLMVAMLRQAGIRADIALVRTRHFGDINPRAVSMALFDHAVVYLPRWNIWLDGTADYAGARELPLIDQGAIAVVVDRAGNATLRRIPVSLPQDNYTRRVVRVELRQNGSLKFTGNAYTRGEDAPGLRREYQAVDQQLDSFRNSLAAILPSVQVDRVHVEGAHDLESDIQVDFDGALDSFAGKSAIALGTSWMQRSYVQKLAPLAARTEDLILPAPWTTVEELRYQLPAGAVVTAVPQNFNLQTDFGSAFVHYQLHGRELVISTSVVFSRLRITPAEYAAFRDFCGEVERAFRNEVKVRLRS